MSKPALRSSGIRRVARILFELVSIGCLAIVLAWVGIRVFDRTVGVTSEVSRIDHATLVNWTNAGMWQGTREASVRIIAYTDYTCHFCAKQDSALAKLRRKFPDHVAVITRPIPNPRSEIASRVAIVARCAGRNAVFDRISLSLYALAERNTQEVETFQRLDPLLSPVELSAVRTCYDGRAVVDEIRRDIDDAMTLGLSITPILIINGLVLPGLTEYPKLEEIAIAEMRRVESDFLAKPLRISTPN